MPYVCLLNAFVSAINLSILDFKLGLVYDLERYRKPINLSILDFKLGLVYDLERYRKRYKSIHIGF